MGDETKDPAKDAAKDPAKDPAKEQPKKSEKPLGTARMKVHSFNEGKVTGVSIGGVSYTPDDKGFIFVRPEHIADAMHHGHEPTWD